METWKSKQELIDETIENLIMPDFDDENEIDSTQAENCEQESNSIKAENCEKESNSIQAENCEQDLKVNVEKELQEKTFVPIPLIIESPNTIILKECIKSVVPNFQYTDKNKKVLMFLAEYLSGFPKFSEEYRKKGILLIGDIGTGKTSLMEIFEKFSLRHLKKFLQVVNVNHLFDCFAKDGRLGLDEIDIDYEICIDDLGLSNGNQYHYGERDDVQEIFLQRRYEKFRRNKIRTHGTSNLDVKGFEERFSPRIFDRMLEMFHFVELSGESWRKINFNNSP